MDSVKIIAILCCLTTFTTRAEIQISDLAENLDILKAKIAQLETKDSELERINLELKEENKDLKDMMRTHMQSGQDAAPEVFDCYRTSSRVGSGVIPYDVCSVDTTLDSPQLSEGYFRVLQHGIYRLTFMGCVFLPPIEGDYSAYGLAMIHVDGTVLATAFLNPIISDTAGYHSLSMDIIHELYPGQIVTTYWAPTDGAYLYTSISSGHIHFTGQFLGSASANYTHNRSDFV